MQVLNLVNQNLDLGLIMNCNNTHSGHFDFELTTYI
jgi:hypothetical protein